MGIEQGIVKQIWMTKTPHQCGDLSVPNSIYFDHPNSLFPENKELPHFPMTFNWKENAIEFYKAQAIYDNKTIEEADQEATARIENLIKLHNELNKSFQFERSITIFDAKKVKHIGQSTCAACSCSEGYSLYILTDKTDIEVLSKLGYTLTEEPK